jgi:hypothetical protein
VIGEMALPGFGGNVGRSLIDGDFADCGVADGVGEEGMGCDFPAGP